MVPGIRPGDIATARRDYDDKLGLPVDGMAVKATSTSGLVMLDTNLVKTTGCAGKSIFDSEA